MYSACDNTKPSLDGPYSAYRILADTLSKSQSMVELSQVTEAPSAATSPSPTGLYVACHMSLVTVTERENITVGAQTKFAFHLSGLAGRNELVWPV